MNLDEDKTKNFPNRESFYEEENDEIFIKVDIVSAEREIFSGWAKYLVISGEEGNLGVCPKHSPLLAAIKPGQIRMLSSSSEESYYYVSGGFVEIQPSIVTVLADTVIRACDIDKAAALKAKEQAEKMLKNPKKLDNYNTIMIKLAKALAKLRVLESSMHTHR